MDANTLGVIAVCTTFVGSAAVIVWRFSGMVESVNNLTKAVEKLTNRVDQAVVDNARLDVRVSHLEKQKR